MNTAQAIVSRARVVMTSLVTYLTAAQVVVQAAIVQFSDVPAVGQYGAQALAFIAGVVVLIRRVTPAEESERGLL